MASFTTVLLQKDHILLQGQKLISFAELSSARIPATTFKAIRKALLLHSIKRMASCCDLGFLSEAMTVTQLSKLISALRSTYQALETTNSGAKLVYVKFMHEVLATIFQFCTPILRLFSSEQRSAIDWLCSSRNVPQVRDDFTAETFRSYSTADCARKGSEIALNLSARCDAEILDATRGLDISLRAALNNNPLRLETSCQWDHGVANLRRFIVVDVVGSFLYLSSTHKAASLYLSILLPALVGLYSDLYEQAWSGDRTYVDAFLNELILVEGALKTYEQARELFIVLNNISQVLSTYSWASKIARDLRLQEGTISPSHNTSQDLIKNVLCDNVLSNWSPTENGYFHARRRTTIPYSTSNSQPSAEVNHASSHTIQRQRSINETYEPAFDFLDLSSVHM